MRKVERLDFLLVPFGRVPDAFASISTPYELGLIDGKRSCGRGLRFKFGVVGLCQSFVTCGDLDLEKKSLSLKTACLPPTLHNTTGFTDGADEPLRQTRPVDHVSPQTLPTQAHVPSPVRTPTTNSDMVDASPAPQHP